MLDCANSGELLLGAIALLILLVLAMSLAALLISVRLSNKGKT